MHACPNLITLASILTCATTAFAQAPPPSPATAAPPPSPATAAPPPATGSASDAPSTALVTLANLAAQAPPAVPAPTPATWDTPTTAPLGPRVIAWREDRAIPSGYHEGSRMRFGLVSGGASLFGTVWVFTAVIGSLGGDFMPVLPVAGPFVLAVQVGGGSAAALVLLDGLPQAAGLAMMIAGFAAREKVLLRADVKEARTWWVPAPIPLGTRGAGLALRGTL